MIVDDGLGNPNISCSCQGTRWINPIDDQCNVLIGGDLDFQQDLVGQSEGTWYNAIRTSWNGPPGNTPDIGNAAVNGNCNQFLALLGDNNPNAGGAVGNKEGLAIRLSNPLPRNGGRLNITLNYSSTLNNMSDLVVIQGSNQITQILPQDCNTNITNGDTYCFGTFLDTDGDCFYDGNNAIGDFMSSAQCDTPLQFCPDTIMLNNLSDNDINIIYISFNVNPDNGYVEEYVFLDDISIEIDPDSYCEPEVEVDGCTIENIAIDSGCRFVLQRQSTNGDWVNVGAPTILDETTDGCISHLDVELYPFKIAGHTDWCNIVLRSYVMILMNVM